MSLEADLLAAHAQGDGEALVDLYARAADRMARGKDEAAAGFFLTQAYVYALERAHPQAAELHQRLVAMGREM